MKLPQYTQKDARIIAVVMPLMVLIVNSILLGSGYFSGFLVFLISTLIAGVILIASWQILTLIAVTLRDRFPKDADLAKRLSIALLLFIIITALTISSIFWIFGRLKLTTDFVDDERLKWVLMAG